MSMHHREPRGRLRTAPDVYFGVYQKSAPAPEI